MEPETAGEEATVADGINRNENVLIIWDTQNHLLSMDDLSIPDFMVNSLKFDLLCSHSSRIQWR